MYKFFIFLFLGIAFITLSVLNHMGILNGWAPFIVMLVLGITMYFVALFRYRELRYIRDTATSKIGSLPVGFVEVCGKARKHPNYSGIYHYLKVREKRTKEARGRFTEGDYSRGVGRDELMLFPFYIDDGTGSVYVNPEKAKIIANTKRWSDDSYRYEEACINDGDNVYCIGTVENTHADLNTQIREALKSSRQSKYFMAKYDLNGDGEISPEEWDNARNKITSDVVGRSINARKGNLLEINKGNGNNIFIISNKSEKELTRGLVRSTLALLLCGILFVVMAIVDTMMRHGVFSPDTTKYYMELQNYMLGILAGALLVVFIIYSVYLYIVNFFGNVKRDR